MVHRRGGDAVGGDECSRMTGLRSASCPPLRVMCLMGGGIYLAIIQLFGICSKLVGGHTAGPCGPWFCHIGVGSCCLAQVNALLYGCPKHSLLSRIDGELEPALPSLFLACVPPPSGVDAAQIEYVWLAGRLVKARPCVLLLILVDVTAAFVSLDIDATSQSPSCLHPIAFYSYHTTPLRWAAIRDWMEMFGTHAVVWYRAHAGVGLLTQCWVEFNRLWYSILLPLYILAILWFVLYFLLFEFDYFEFHYFDFHHLHLFVLLDIIWLCV